MARIAIVLRGPPCAGKSTILRALQEFRALNPQSKVSLDDGWTPGERRQDRSTRYADLLGQPDVLLIELGYGDDASHRPREWLDLLERDNREVFFFLLEIDRAECLRREASRNELSLDYAATAWDRYADSGPCANSVFTSKTGTYQEVRITTMPLDVGAAVQTILAAVVQSLKT